MNRRDQVKISNYIIRRTTLLFLLPFSLIFITSILLAFSIYLKDQTEIQELAVLNLARGTESQMKIYEDTVTGYGNYIDREKLNRRENREGLLIFLETLPVEDIRELWLVDSESKQLTYSSTKGDSLSGFEIGNMPILPKILKENQDAYWSPIMNSPFNYQPGIAYSVFYNEFIITAWFDIHKIMGFVENQEWKEGQYGFVTDQNGRILFHNSKQLILQRETMTTVPAVRNSLNSNRPFSSISAYPNYPLSQYSSVKSEVNGWVYGIATKLSTFFMFFIVLLIGIIVAYILGGVLILMNSLSISRRINKELEILLTNSNMLIKGVYNIDTSDFNLHEFTILDNSFLILRDAIMDRESKLKKLNDNLEMEVMEQTHNLVEKNVQLEQTLDKLKLTQNQLIDSEKLASLGRMMTGLAHKLNTPLGTALTIGSYLNSEFETCLEKINKKSMPQEVLNEQNRVFKESFELLLSNLKKSSVIISNLKAVTIEVNTSSQSEFHLNEIVKTALYEVKKIYPLFQVEYSINIDKEITLISYPQVVFQVLEYVIKNIYEHAFPNQIGDIEFSARIDEQDLVEIIISDDGVGFEEDLRVNAFEPFVSGNMGKDGYGLGLYFAYLLVTNILGGTISLKSLHRSGTNIIIKLPKTVE